MASLATLFTVMGGVGAGAQALGTITQGREVKAQAQYQAEVAEQNADEAQASSQRDAEAQRRQGALIESRQRAAIAGGGGSTADPSVLDLMGDTASAADLNARTDLYKGAQQAAGYQGIANVDRVNARAAMPAAYLGATSDLFSGVSSLYERFGKPAKQVDPTAGIQIPYPDRKKNGYR